MVQALARLAAAHEAGGEGPAAVVVAALGAEARRVVAVAVPQQLLLRHAGIAERAGHEVGRAEQRAGGRVLALLARQPLGAAHVRARRVGPEAELAADALHGGEGELRVGVGPLEQPT